MAEPTKMASSVEPRNHAAPSSSQVHDIIGVAPNQKPHSQTPQGNCMTAPVIRACWDASEPTAGWLVALYGTVGQAGLNGQHGRTSRNPKRPLSPCAYRLSAVAQTAGTVCAAVTYDAAAHHVCVSSGEDGSAAYLAGRSDQHGELNGF